MRRSETTPQVDNKFGADCPVKIQERSTAAVTADFQKDFPQTTKRSFAPYSMFFQRIVNEKKRRHLWGIVEQPLLRLAANAGAYKANVSVSEVVGYTLRFQVTT